MIDDKKSLERNEAKLENSLNLFSSITIDKLNNRRSRTDCLFCREMYYIKIGQSSIPSFAEALKKLKIKILKKNVLRANLVFISYIVQKQVIFFAN